VWRADDHHRYFIQRLPGSRTASTCDAAMMTDINRTGQNRLDEPILPMKAIATEIERITVNRNTKITQMNTDVPEKETGATINATLVSRVCDGERCNPHSQRRSGAG